MLILVIRMLALVIYLLKLEICILTLVIYVLPLAICMLTLLLDVNCMSTISCMHVNIIGRHISKSLDSKIKKKMYT